MQASHLVGGKMEGFSSLCFSSDYLKMVITQFIDYAALPTEEVTLITWQGKKRTHAHTKSFAILQGKTQYYRHAGGKRNSGMEKEEGGQ